MRRPPREESGGEKLAKRRRDGLCDNLKVVDFGTGLAGSLVAKLLVEAGAGVTRPSAGHDPFADIYPAYDAWQRGKAIRPIDGLADPALDAALAAADVCIVGGEDHPDAPPRPDGATLAAKYPRLIVLEITAGPDSPATPAVDLLAQVRSGFAHEHFSTRPIMFAFPLASYGAALQGTVALLAALCEREESGLGQLVSTSLLEGGMMWCAPLWFQAERPDRAILADIPRDVQPLIFRCKDGRYIHFMMGTPGALGKVHRILGIDDSTVDPNDRGMPTGKGERKNFWGNIELFQSHMIRFDSNEILHALWNEGMGAELVQPPGACWDDPQVVHNGIITCTRAVSYVGFPITHADNVSTAEVARPAKKEAKSSAAGGPLSGLKVLDFGSFVAGPYLSVLLGDLGAEVFKFEGMGGDVNRTLLRAFACTNRGKRSIAIDVKSPDGPEILRRACLWADVVHHNSRPGVSKKLGVDAETLHAVKPELVVEETSGYGADGPKAQRAGFDMLFQAFCGHEFRGSGEGDVPLWNRSAIVDFGAGMLGAIGALFALLQRRRGGRPSAIFVNLLDTGLYLMSELIQKADGSFAGAPRMNAELTGPNPAERLYQTSDGWLAIAVRGDEMARRLADALGLGRVLAAPVASWTEKEGFALAGAFRSLSLRDAAASLAAANVWFEVSHHDQQDRSLADEHLQRCGIVLRTVDRKYGDFRQIGPAFRFSRTALRLDARGHIPALGEHSHYILAELGFTPSRIDELFANGAVG